MMSRPVLTLCQAWVLLRALIERRHDRVNRDRGQMLWRGGRLDWFEPSAVGTCSAVMEEIAEGTSGKERLPKSRCSTIPLRKGAA